MFRSLFALGVMGIGVLGATASQDLWDLDWAKTAPLEVEVISESTREVDGIPMIARELSYLSHEWRGASIRIAGHYRFASHWRVRAEYANTTVQFEPIAPTFGFYDHRQSLLSVGLVVTF